MRAYKDTWPAFRIAVLFIHCKLNIFNVGESKEIPTFKMSVGFSKLLCSASQLVKQGFVRTQQQVG